MRELREQQISGLATDAGGFPPILMTDEVWSIGLLMVTGDVLCISIILGVRDASNAPCGSMFS